jgi:futalosine hydrolase
MKILVVAATKYEIDLLLGQMEKRTSSDDAGLIRGVFKNIEIDFLITGVGKVATSYYCGKVINESYDIAFNLGICGSFNFNLEIGTVVNVYEDIFSELGAEDDDVFLSLEQLKLQGVTKIKNEFGALNVEIEKLPKVNGITVNTTHGNEKTIEQVTQRFHPIVESMEGAAFMFACENERIPYVQIRAVSNFVERRNKENWDIPKALKNLNDTFIKILESF